LTEQQILQLKRARDNKDPKMDRGIRQKNGGKGIKWISVSICLALRYFSACRFELRYIFWTETTVKAWIKNESLSLVADLAG
jgi:hypothetical protein